MRGSTKKKIYIFIFAFFCVLLLNSCEKKKIEINDDYLQLKDYIITNEKDNKILLNKLNNNNIEKVKEVEPFLDMDFKENVNVFNVQKDVGENLINTKLIIDTKEKREVLEKEYNYRYFKLSPNGQFIAFTSFSTDDYSSANNIKIYDIKNKKYIEFPDNILLSGDLFSWENDDNIIFYGIESGNNKNSKIYKHSIKDNETKVFYEKIDGYVMNFSIIDENQILLLESNEVKNTLSVCNIKDNSKIKLSNDIRNVSESVISKDKTTIYFVSKLSEKKNVIYKINLNSNNLKRVTFDFPPNIETFRSLYIEENNDLIIIGKNNKDKNLIYKYEDKSNVISLVYGVDGEYRIFSP